MKTDPDGFKNLGPKAFYLSILRRSGPAFAVLLIEIVLIVLQFIEKNDIAHSTVSPITTFMQQYPMSDALLNNMIGWSLLVFIVVLGMTVVIGYIAFAYFLYRVNENGLAMKRGFISREELSLPFRQIQNIDLEQSFLDRILGICDLVILTAGHEDKEYADKNQAEIVLSAMDFEVAKDLQHRLLERANLQEVVSVQEPEDMKMEHIQTPPVPLTNPENK